MPPDSLVDTVEATVGYPCGSVAALGQNELYDAPAAIELRFPFGMLVRIIVRLAGL